MVKNVSFKGTVLARFRSGHGVLGPIDLSLLEPTVKEVFGIEDLEPRSYEEYKQDMVELGMFYRLSQEEVDRLISLIPDLTPAS